VLYQNDDTGRDYLNGFRDGLGDRQKLIVAEASYEVTAPTLDSQLLQLRAAGADVLFDQTTPKFAAQVIRKLAEIGWKPLHYLNNIAASIGAVLVPAGLDNATGILSSTFLKDTTDPQLADDPAVREWLAFMKTYLPGGNLLDSLNVTGYAVAQTVVQVLRQCGDKLTRENVMQQAANLKDLQLGLLMPGVKINTGPGDYAPIESLRMRRFDGKQWLAFGEVMGR
jgi:branched-chain amino acid transport system substrate-binding protein